MRTLLALSALTLLCACSHAVDTASAPSFGVSTQMLHNAQTVLGPVSEEPPEGSGAQGALAQDRYQTGQTRPLLPTTTSSANPTTN
jgi:hypothetical protein